MLYWQGSCCMSNVDLPTQKISKLAGASKDNLSLSYDKELTRILTTRESNK